MAIFYGLYLDDAKLGGALDLIRFLAEPAYFRRAHITVRGPYDDEEAVREEIDLLNIAIAKDPYVIEIDGVGAFFEKPTQSTVYLKCSIRRIETIWHKPSFAGAIRPHLTLYDRNDRSLAWALREILEKYPWKIRAQASLLRPIATKQTPSSSSLDLFFKQANQWSLEIFGREVDYQGMRLSQWRERLKYVPQICDYVHRHYLARTA